MPLPLLPMNAIDCCSGIDHADPRDAGYGYMARDFKAPCGMTGFGTALNNKAQNYFMRLLVGDNTFQNAVENEALLHFMLALVQRKIPLLQPTVTRCGSSATISLSRIFLSMIFFQLPAKDVFSR